MNDADVQVVEQYLNTAEMHHQRGNAFGEGFALGRAIEHVVGAARREYDNALSEANETFRDGVKKLQEERAEARKAAWDAYTTKRDEILKAFSAKQAA